MFRILPKVCLAHTLLVTFTVASLPAHAGVVTIGKPDAEPEPPQDAPPPQPRAGKNGKAKAHDEKPLPVLGSDAPPGEVAFLSCLKNVRKLKWTGKQDFELDDLVGWMKSITCKTFIVPQNVRSQKVKIVMSDQELTPQEAYRIFLSALNAMGLTVVASGGALQVVETPRVKESAEVYDADRRPPNDERYVTQLLRVRNVPAGEMGAVLQKLRSKDGDISWYDPTGTLILTDTAQNVRRMTEVAEALDISGSSEKIWIVRLHNTSATEVAQKIGEIFQVTSPSKGGGSPGGGQPGVNAPRRGPQMESVGNIVEQPSQIAVSKVIPDERSNSLILVASEHAYGRLYALIKRLDASREEAEALGDGRVHVYALANANAEELAATLGGLTGATVSGGGGTSTRRRTGSNQSQTPTPTPTPTPTQGGQQGQSTLFEGDVRISPDKPTNSLVVLSSLKDFLTLKRVIRQLDVPRRQVFIEGAILEVSLDRSNQLGAYFHAGALAGSGADQVLIFGGLGASKTLLPAGAAGATGSSGAAAAGSGLLGDLAQGLAAGALGPQIQGTQTFLPGLSIPSFGVFMKLLATSNDVNVLSTPHILTTDNEEAQIKVGQNVPFQGAFLGGFGTPSTAGGAAGGLGFSPSVSVQRQDVALDLKITPHVNDSGMVRLEVEQEISDIASENFNNLGPVTSKRTVKTVVVVKDQQPVVLGGLITDRTTNTVQKVPLLGDIPILGYFFKNTVKKIQKTNLLVFLTPHVISDQSDLKRIFERKWQERREFLERYTAFSHERDSDEKIDYRHKRGLLEEINRTARDMEDEQTMLERIRAAENSDDQGPVELPPGFTPRRAAPTTAPTGTPGTVAPSGPVPVQPAPPSGAPAQPPPPTGAPQNTAPPVNIEPRAIGSGTPPGTVTPRQSPPRVP